MPRKEQKKSSMEIEAANLMLTPCTAAKSEKEAVAGVELECPSTKRKSVAGSSYKAGDEPPEGWIDVYKLADPPSSDPFGLKSREEAIDKILADAVLGKQGVEVEYPSSKRQAVAGFSQKKPASFGEEAIEKILADAVLGKQGPKVKRRLTKGEIMSILAVKPRPFPSELTEFESPEVAAEMKRQFEEEEAFFRASDEKREAFRQQLRRGLEENGYYEVEVEVDQDSISLAKRENARKRASQPPFSPFADVDPELLRGLVATPEQMQRWRREGAIRPYRPSAEEALLISYGEDDTEGA